MRKRLFIALILILMLVPTFIAQANKPAPALKCTIEYSYVGHLEEFDDEGRLQVWEGTISGDIEGSTKWWFVLGGGPPNMPDSSKASHYEARWEIFDLAGNLVLAGDSSGVTASPPDKDGIWNGHGKVTEAYGEFEDWIGRQTHEAGSVIWVFPFSGSGTFRIN
jgi:hypothetical protein